MRNWTVLVFLFLSFFAVTTTHAQTVSLEYEYSKKIDAANRLAPLDAMAFGNSTDDAAGRTVFANTDISLPGNDALPVSLGRRLPIDYRFLDQELGGIGNWDIEVPYIEGTFSKLYGWSVAPNSSPNRYKRCSYPNAPMVEGGTFLPHEMSHGYRIHVPGLLDDSLSIDTTAYVDPTDGKVYPWILKSMDRLGCLPSLKTGQSGEGFVLLTKNGVKYYFDYMIERKAVTLRRSPKGCGDDMLRASMQLPRTRLFLLATRIEDRFGNFVNYTYSNGTLVSIAASDGRQIELKYGQNNITATASGRTWSYILQDGHLSSVINPDGSRWGYGSFGSPTYISGWDEGVDNLPSEAFDPDFSCTQQPSQYISGQFFQVDHPSGAVGKFTFEGKNFGRSHVMYVCNITYVSNDSGYANIAAPNYFGAYALTKLDVQGVGAALQSTTFQYDVESYPYCDQILSATGEYITARCNEPQCADGECVDPVGRWVTTVRPDGTKARKRFGVIFGKLRQTSTYSADGTLATITDGRGNTTVFSSWKRGIPQLIQHPATPESPAGATESATVDNSGWVTSATDENGFVTGYGYDAMGRLASIVYPTGDGVAYHNTVRNFRPLTSSDAKPTGIVNGQWRLYEATGNYVKLTYMDALWRPVLAHEYDAVNAASTLRAIRTAYDTNGRVNFQSYPSTDAVPGAAGTRTFYDALDRITRVEQDSELGILATTTEYLAGLKIRVKNPRNFQTTTSYMAWDHPGYDLPVLSEQPEGKVIEITRHPQFGWPQLLKQRNATGSLQASRRYVYDGNAQLCKIIEPETGAAVMGYDDAGNLAWSVSGLDSISFFPPRIVSIWPPMAQAWRSRGATTRTTDSPS